jgi:hypothetical protein
MGFLYQYIYFHDYKEGYSADATFVLWKKLNLLLFIVLSVNESIIRHEK